MTLLSVHCAGLRLEMAPKCTFVFGLQWSYNGAVGEEGFRELPNNPEERIAHLLRGGSLK